MLIFNFQFFVHVQMTWLHITENRELDCLLRMQPITLRLPVCSLVSTGLACHYQEHSGSLISAATNLKEKVGIVSNQHNSNLNGGVTKKNPCLGYQARIPVK